MGITPRDVTPECWAALQAADRPATPDRGTILDAFRRPPPAGTTEREFQAEVVRLAQLLGWRVAYFRPARVSRGGRTTYETPVGADGKGFPDLELVRGRLVKAECKVGKNTRTAEQLAWAEAYHRAGVEYHLWYPRDWPTILEVLA